MVFILRIRTTAGTARTISLSPGLYCAGSDEACEIRIDDPYVSRRHAELRVAGGQVSLRDLGSTNGTRMGRESITGWHDFTPGTVVSLGTTALELATEAREQLLPVPVASRSIHGEAIGMTPETPLFRELKREVHSQVLEYLDLHRRAQMHALNQEELRSEALEAVRAVIDSGRIEIPGAVSRDRLERVVVAEAVGLGVIEGFLEDEEISEIMVNGPDQVYVERRGVIEPTGMRFTGTASLLNIIERIVTPLGRRIDEGSPMVDARLPDGSRVNAVIPPLSLVGPALTIRKFSSRRLGVADLVSNGTLSPLMAEFLELCVRHRRNIVVSGGTGSGKTTTLNVLSNFVADNERIVTIEDAAELRLHQEHVVSLESRPPNVEGRGAVSIRDLVRNALRMRPDRIVVGECRGGEALDMLQAMNTGHDGSLTTGHANSPRDFLSRLEVMVLMSGIELPIRAIREQIASAVDIIIHQSRFSDGRRRITSIVEVDGMEGDVILLQELFRFQQTGRRAGGGIAGQFKGCGQAPGFYAELEQAGETPRRGLFGELDDDIEPDGFGGHG